MSIIQSLLGDKLGNLTQMLTGDLGFSELQASEFVPEAAKGFLNAFQEKSADIDTSNIASSASTLLESMNLGAIAEKVGIDEQQVQSGISAIMPTLLGLAEEHKDKIGGLGSLVSNLQDSPIGGMLGGLGSKLFGK